MKRTLTTREHNDIPIAVERTGRKRTASFQVDNGRVRVLVPRHLTDRDVSALIARKMPWIEQTIEVQAGRLPAVHREYVTGETFSYLGRRYTLELVVDEDGDDRVRLHRGRLLVGSHGGSSGAPVRDRLVEWYRSHAFDRLVERTRRFAQTLDVPARSVAVREYRSRWGSCASDGRITYNWKIIVAPGRIVDYVVVHELCHLIEQNHSRAYWRIVEAAMPDYRDRRRWLRDHGHLLEV